MRDNVAVLSTPFKPVPAEMLKTLARPNPALSIAFIAMEWLAIGSAIWVCQRYWNPLLYIVTVMWIGNRQHALAIQMHDGSHSLISKRKWLNDALAEVFCAWPMFFKMEAYRRNHLQHHRYTNTSLDPDFRPERFPETRGEILRMLARDLVGLGMIDQFRELKRLKMASSTRMKLVRFTYYAAIACAITALGGWKCFALYWLVPIFTWLKVVLRIRAIADHAGVERQPHPFNTRTVVPNLFDRIFLAPRGCSYHLGHHFYGTIPCHRLKKLHGILMANPVVAANARVTHGFINLLAEFPGRAECDLDTKAG